MQTTKKGKLKIFFGYCAGVGKTFKMLEEANKAKDEGIDVVIGYIERHDRPETLKLMEPLEVIPDSKIKYKNVMLEEMNLDLILARNPKLAIVDELAHTNVMGSRHSKRYNDVQELLQAGIDVYTTLNVQHLESLQDIVASITRIYVNERIPDKIFDQADQVILVDIEPIELIKRLNEGKIYKKAQINRALNNFFITNNLVALREIALRRVADRVNKTADVATKGFTKEHIMICLSKSPTNASVIRTASRMAAAFHGEFTALYVETPDTASFTNDDKKQLEYNIKLAQQLGANIVSVFGEDIAEQISEYAKISGTSKVIIGRSFNKHSIFSKNSLIDSLTALSPNLDIYIIPDNSAKKRYNKKGNYQGELTKFNIMDTFITAFFLIASTIIGILFYAMGYTEANVIMIYLLAVLLISYMTTSKIYGIVASIAIVFIFNFFFTDPRFSFQAYDKSYPITFLIMLFVSIISNTITRKAKQQMKASAMQAHRMEVLLEISQRLQLANSMSEIAEETCLQLYRLLNKTIIVYSVKNNQLQQPIIYNENLNEEIEEIYCNSNEQAVAQWVFKNNKNAGVSTNTLPAAKGLYFAVRMKDKIYAVIGIAMNPNEKLPPFERSLLTAMLNEIALNMEAIKRNVKK